MLHHLAKIMAFFNFKMHHSIVHTITNQISETSKQLLFISLIDSTITQKQALIPILFEKKPLLTTLPHVVSTQMYRAKDCRRMQFPYSKWTKLD